MASLIALAAPPLEAVESPPPHYVGTRVGLLSLDAPAAAARSLEPLAGRAEEILRRVENDLGIRPAARFRMILVPPGEILDPALARFDAEAPEWAAGYMDPVRRIGAIRIAQSAQYPYGTLEAVLAHEATHQMLHDAVGGRIPLWFNEGVATMQGRRWSFEDYRIVTRSLLTSDLPRLSGLDSLFHATAAEADLAYAASFSFVSWTARRYGAGVLRDVLRETRTRRFEQAWRVSTGVSLDESERAWRRTSLFRYRWFPILTASSTLWLGVTLLFFLAGWRKRARVRELQKRWAEEERDLEEWTDPEDGPPFSVT